MQGGNENTCFRCSKEFQPAHGDTIWKNQLLGGLKVMWIWFLLLPCQSEWSSSDTTTRRWPHWHPIPLKDGSFSESNPFNESMCFTQVFWMRWKWPFKIFRNSVAAKGHFGLVVVLYFQWLGHSQWAICSLISHFPFQIFTYFPLL